MFSAFSNLYIVHKSETCAKQRKGINQSASVTRVWPGQPQGVVLVLKLAQVAGTDDHFTACLLQRPDKQVLIYYGSILHPLRLDVTMQSASLAAKLF
jgi:hypothetical protein